MSEVLRFLSLLFAYYIYILMVHGLVQQVCMKIECITLFALEFKLHFEPIFTFKYSIHEKSLSKLSIFADTLFFFISYKHWGIFVESYGVSASTHLLKN